MAGQDFTQTQGQLSDSVAEIGPTIPTGRELQITKMTLTNTSGSDIAGVSIHIAIDGGAASAANKVFDGFTMAGGETRSLNVAGHSLPPGAKVYGVSGTAATINYLISYYTKLTR